LHISNVHPKKSIDTILKEFDLLSRGEKKIAEDVPCLRKDGKILYADIRTGIISLEDRKYIIGFFADITEQKKTRDELHGQLVFLQTLIDTIPSPIFYKDEHGCYLGCNRAFEKVLGLTREDLVGKSVHDISPKDLADKYKAADKVADDELLESRQVQAYEVSVKSADGTRHDVIMNKAVFLKKDNTVGGLVGVMIDIAERKRAEAEKKVLEARLHQNQKMEAFMSKAGRDRGPCSRSYYRCLTFRSITTNPLTIKTSQGEPNASFLWMTKIIKQKQARCLLNVWAIT